MSSTQEAPNSPAPVTMIIGATSKWQSDGGNTQLVHGAPLDDTDLPVSARWGIGGALAQRFAAEGHRVAITTRRAANADALRDALIEQGGEVAVVELDVGERDSVAVAFEHVRNLWGDPEVVIYNAGYIDGRDLPPEKELMEFIPPEVFETAMAVACRGPYFVAQEALPAMREAGQGSLLFTNNAWSLRGRKRNTGESLYYPRTLMKALAQALTEEYSEFGVHVANVVVDGLIDSPGTRALPVAVDRPEIVMDPAQIADAFWYLHRQHRSVWTHELQLTPYSTKPSF